MNVTRGHRAVPFMRGLLPLLAAAVLIGAACTSSTPGSRNAQTVRLLTYDSFALPADIWDDFTKETGLKVEVLAKGDTGPMLNTAILTKGEPIGDVMWAVDKTLLSRAAAAQIFAPHELAEVPVNPALLSPLVPDQLVPVDTGEICVNVDAAAMKAAGLIVPATFEDLAKPEYKDKFVVQNPATSPVGLGFLFASIEHFGEQRWQQYWSQLAANGVKIVNGWDEAWNTEFTGAGQGTRPIVVSYSTSPVAVVAFGTDPNATSSSVVSLSQTCFATTEYAGVLAGTGNEANGRKLLAYLLSERVQGELPTNMFVYPTRNDVALPEIYARLGIAPTSASPDKIPREIELTPERIQGMRDVWVDEWTKLVLP